VRFGAFGDLRELVSVDTKRGHRSFGFRGHRFTFWGLPALGP
jgi:hypothetical protein